MKKLMTLLLAVALVMSLSVPAFATEYDETDTEATVNLSFSLLAAPSYTVTIPGSLNLVEGNNYLPITVSDSADLNGGSVVVTYEETSCSSFGSYFCTYLLIDGGTDELSSVYDYIYYGIYDYLNNFVDHSDTGTTVALFTTDGTKSITLKIVSTDYMLQPTATYTGWITFGIAYVPAP